MVLTLPFERVHSLTAKNSEASALAEASFLGKEQYLEEKLVLRFRGYALRYAFSYCPSDNAIPFEEGAA